MIQVEAQQLEDVVVQVQPQQQKTLLVDYTKGRANNNSNPETGLSSGSGHSKSYVMKPEEALCTVEYLLSLPMEDPMNDSFDLRTVSTKSCGISTADSCDSSCASFADCDEDDDDSVAAEAAEPAPAPAPTTPSAALRRTNSVRRGEISPTPPKTLRRGNRPIGAAEVSAAKDNRRAMNAKSVSFTMRRSRRNLNRSKTFDERLSTNERLHNSLVGILKQENEVESLAKKRTPQKTHVEEKPTPDIINLKPKTVIRPNHLSSRKNRSLNGSLSFHESSKSLFGGKALKRQASFHSLINTNSTMNLNASSAMFNESMSTTATTATTTTTSTTSITANSEHTTTSLKSMRMQKLSSNNNNNSNNSKKKEKSSKKDLLSLNSNSNHSYLQKKHHQAGGRGPQLPHQMAYFQKEPSRRNMLQRSDSDSTIGDSMADDSSISMQFSALQSRRGGKMLSGSSCLTTTSNQTSMTASSTRYTSSYYSSTTSSSNQDSSFLEQSSSLFVTGSRIKRHS